MEYSDTILNAVSSYMERKNYHCIFNPFFRELSATIYSSSHIIRYVLMNIIIDKDAFTTLTYFPILVPKDRRAEVADLILRINWKQSPGAWELNMNSGEIRYKLRTPCPDQNPSALLIAAAVHTPLSAFSNYSRSLFEVIAGTKTSEEAYSDISKWAMRIFRKQHPQSDPQPDPGDITLEDLDALAKEYNGTDGDHNVTDEEHDAADDERDATDEDEN